jgi:hypothetical protein
MTTTNGWLGKPGVPPQDGIYWLKHNVVGDKQPCLYEKGKWYCCGSDIGLSPMRCAARYSYLGPCLTPDEVQNLRDDLVSAERERAHQHGRADRNAAEHAREQAKREALQKRVAELETALQFIKDAPDEDRKPNFNNMGSYEAGLRYCAAFARAALGGKDEPSRN